VPFPSHYPAPPNSITFSGAFPDAHHCAAEGHAVDLAPVDTVLAPARSTDDSQPSLEHAIGELVAQVAAALAAGLRAIQRGKLSSSTKARGGDLIAGLFALRQVMIGTWDFDGICRQHGAAVLREQYGSDVDARTIEELVGAVMEILAKVTRAAAN